MPNSDVIATTSVSRFDSRSSAFRQGVKDAIRAPVLVLFAGMVGFGAVGKTYGVDLIFTTLSTLLIFALPGQIVLLEMIMSGASLLSIGIAVSLTSSRFVTMVVTLFPQLHQNDKNRTLYAKVHLLAMTTWTVSMREFSYMAPEHRASYFLGFGLPCWLLSVPATALGYLVAGYVPAAITLSLVLLNPLFFLLTFTEVKLLSNRMAILFGSCLGPAFYLLDRDTSLLAAGLAGGSLAYGLERVLSSTKKGTKNR